MYINTCISKPELLHVPVLSYMIYSLLYLKTDIKL